MLAAAAQFVVPQRCVPAIIGTKGARVRDINDRYDTKIEVSSSSNGWNFVAQ